MRTCKIAARNEETKEYYYLELSEGQVKKYDNFALVSCGLSIPSEISQLAVDRMIAKGRATKINHDTWNHSGCLSRCVNQGGDKCQW